MMIEDEGTWDGPVEDSAFDAPPEADRRSNADTEIDPPTDKQLHNARRLTRDALYPANKTREPRVAYLRKRM